VKSKHSILTICLILIYANLYGQISGKYAFPFLEQGISARTVALGGNVAAINDGDISLALLNPSLINSSMNNALSLSYVNYFADANYGMAQYSRTFDKAGSYVASLQFMDYGSFNYADVYGNRTGSFSAADYAFSLGWGRQLNQQLSIGATAKFLYSHYETYRSFGIAVDVAGTYISKSNWIVSLLASNIGTQLASYTGQTDPLPFDLQLALSKRLEHVPFRVSLVIDHLEKLDLSFQDPANPPGGFDPLSGDPIMLSGISKFSNLLMRHFIIGGEFYLGKNLVLRAGYNYRRRRELSINQRLGMVGFSWGFGIHISHFQINFARSTYHLAGSPNYLTLTTSLDDFRKR